MTDVVCTIRLGAAFSNVVPAVWRDESSTFTAEFRDRATGDLLDATDVTARLWYPSGAEADAPTTAESAAGIWTASITPIYEGLHRVEFSGAYGADTATAAFSFQVKATEPDDGPPPDPSYIEAAALMQRAEAGATRAETAQAAAEAAASSSLGPMTVTTVGGSVDGSGNCLIYTGTLTSAPTLGAQAHITPHAPNAAGPRLRPTVASVLQSQVSIRDASAGALGAGALQTGRTYLLWYDGTYWRVLAEVGNTRRVKATALSDIYAAPGDEDGYGRLKLSMGEDGTLLVQTGDGTAATGWRSRFGYYDGAFRIYDPAAYLGPAALGEDARILTDHYPPLTYRTAKNLRQQPWRNNARTSVQRLILTEPVVYQPGGLDTADKRYIIVSQAASGSFIDLVHMPYASEVVVICQGTAVAHLYTGEGSWSGNGSTAASLTAHSWVNTGTKILTTSAGAWVSIMRDVYEFHAAARDGSVADGTGATLPGQDLVVGAGPQSWARDWMLNAAAGVVARLAALGLGTSYCAPDTANVGASTLLYFAAKASLFHWDQRTDVPGRRLLDIIAAIQADRTARTAMQGSTAPAMSDFIWYFGLNDLGEFGPSSTHPANCPAVWTASFVKMCQYMHAQLGYSMRHWIMPLTSQKFGTFGTSDAAGTDADEMACWHAMRMAHLRCPDAGAAASPAVTIRMIPEGYGDPRSDDDEAEEGERHYDHPVHALQADRWTQAYANEAHGQSNFTGPFIPDASPVASADSGAGIEWDVTIDYGVGRAINQATRPEAAGFRLLPEATGDSDTDDWATPLDILATRWVAGTGTTIKLRCTLAEPYLAGTPRPSVLWGAAEATEQIDCLIFATDPVSGKRYYLRQYLSGG